MPLAKEGGSVLNDVYTQMLCLCEMLEVKALQLQNG